MLTSVGYNALDYLPPAQEDPLAVRETRSARVYGGLRRYLPVVGTPRR